MKEVVRTSPLALVAALVVLVLGTAASAGAVNPKSIANGFNGAIGADLDEVNNYLYFVEYNTGQLKRLELNPDCLDLDRPDLCPVQVVATGFSHPEDVALNIGAGLAYVTTRDSPGSGGLYRVDIATGTKTLLTFNLGAPQQLEIRPGVNKAYTVGYGDGRLREIDLTTGVKTALVKNLNQPVGFVLSDDGKFALIGEQGTNTITRFDLALGVRLSPAVATGVTAPFFMSWSDTIGTSLYVAQRSPLNRVAKVDLASGDLFPTFSGLPLGVAEAVVDSTGNRLFITTNTEILVGSVGLDPLLHPDLMGIGHITVSEINRYGNGYANSDNGYYKNAPFGGTLSIFANLTNFHSMGADFYRLRVSKNGGPSEAVTRNWGTKLWDPTPPKGAYKPITVKPVPATDVYEIPQEYKDGRAAWWYPPFLIMKYPTAENGLYQIELEILASPGDPPLGTYSMLIRVDNIKPDVNIHNIYQCVPDPISSSCPVEVEPCDIVSHDDTDPTPEFLASSRFTFKITARDNEGHLRLYKLYGMYGDNQHIQVAYRHYNQVVAPPPDPWGPHAPIFWHGPHLELTDITTLPCNCAYTFYLYAWSRTTNGWGYLHKEWADYHKSFTLYQDSTALTLPSCVP